MSTVQKPCFGVIGCTARDSFVEDARIVASSPVLVACGEERYALEASGPAVPGAKITVPNMPAALRKRATRARIGGGAFNSLKAIEMIAPDLMTAYLDACAPDPEVMTEMAHTDAVFLGLREVPTNLIFGDRGDKIICKQPVQPATDLTAEQAACIDAFLNRCDALLINSVKDPPVEEAVITGAVRRGIPFAYVITGSSPRGSRLGKILRPASLIIAGLDELGPVLGIPSDKPLSEAIPEMQWLRDEAPGALRILTKGKEGALVSEPDGDGAIDLVRLKAAFWREVQAFLAANSTGCCGAGDALAGGASVSFRRRSRRSTSGAGRRNLYSLGVSVVTCGSRTALRWLGYARSVGPAHFDVIPLARSVGAQTFFIAGNTNAALSSAAPAGR